MFEGLLQPTHLILIMALVVIFFGPGKLADVGSSLGKGMRELRRSMEEPDETPAQPQAVSVPAERQTPGQ